MVSPTASSLLERIHRPSGRIGTISATIYGKGGCGKTTLLGTMPGQGLVLDIPQVEGGTMVLSDQEDHIDVMSVEHWDVFGHAFDALNAGMVSPNTNKKYRWVAIDSITAAQELAKRKALSERSIESAPTQVTQQNWGQIGQLMSELFYRYRTLPVHVIFLAQERLRETGDIYEYQPAVSPMSLDALVPSQYLIGRLSVAEVTGENGLPQDERRLRVGQSERYVAKARAVPGRPLKPILKNPNLREIFAWLLGVPNATEPDGITVAASANPFAPTGE